MAICRLLLCGVLVGAGCVLTGCGPGSDTVPVSGIVTYQGQPLAEVMVTFFPEEGRPASGVTNASGRYTLSTFASNDGAIAGEHRVVITEHYPPEAPPPFPGDEGPSALGKDRFPAKYSHQHESPLNVSVSREISNYDLELSDD